MMRNMEYFIDILHMDTSLSTLVFNSRDRHEKYSFLKKRI